MLFNRHGDIKLCLVRLKNSKVGHDFRNIADTDNWLVLAGLFPKDLRLKKTEHSAL